MKRLFASGLAVAAAMAASTAAAQPLVPVRHVQTAAEALAQDAANYAGRHQVSIEEAARRLRAQQDSVGLTDRLRERLGRRLAGIAIEHHPQYRISVLLTGSEPVPDQAELAAGSSVPIVFRLGATATREQIVAAIRRHQPELSALSRGMGLDPRSGELVLLVGKADAARTAEIDRTVEALTGVPVRVALAAGHRDLVQGGARITGLDPLSGRRQSCTTGFVVEKQGRTGIVTAAHCPDDVTYRDHDGVEVPLEFAGGWGVGHQDVQVHVTSLAREPIFYADRRQGLARRLTGARPLQSTRAGDTVCKWGESSGYSCAEIEFTDFAPPGDLCAGLCAPVWVSVTGPQCQAGDSGGPVFRGTIAFGITKGSSSSAGRCNFYYYMSTDFLPDGWTLARGREIAASD
ncbi:MAG TPA: hypothetical protein VM265_04875 [Sphingomicrobium sp.]|nr:hypothetical protein [Sphingomicrobium sp.]